MSAENQLSVFKMEDGTLWIADHRSGDTEHEAMGEVTHVLSKHDSYEACAKAFAIANDPESAGYYYAECGGYMPTKEELERRQPCYLKSHLWVQFRGRRCGCIGQADLLRKRWYVTEGSALSRGSRTLVRGVTYAEALTVAHIHKTMQPGECASSAPQFFQDLRQGRKHDCLRVYQAAELPGVQSYREGQRDPLLVWTLRSDKPRGRKRRLPV